MGQPKSIATLTMPNDCEIWLLDRCAAKTVTVRDIVRCGPNSLRTTKRVKALIKILVDHGWLWPVAEGYQIVRGEK